MKITLELEVGPETGVVAGALEQQLKMFNEARDMGRPMPMLMGVTLRILNELEAKVEAAMRTSTGEYYPGEYPGTP